jgi:hypothetical protein
MAVYILLTSPASFEKAGIRGWARVEMLPAAGTGPFRLSKVQPPEFAELTRFEGYWDQAHKANVEVIRLLPISEANSRLAALRSGQVDWIEVPPPDGIPSLKAAGFSVVTNSYPHIWTWIYNMAATNSPFRDVRVRQALNYCIDRDGLVTLLNGTAEPSVGWLKPANPGFGNPANRYGFDPAKGKALLAEAGYTAAKPLSFAHDRHLSGGPDASDDARAKHMGKINARQADSAGGARHQHCLASLQPRTVDQGIPGSDVAVQDCRPNDEIRRGRKTRGVRSFGGHALGKTTEPASAGNPVTGAKAPNGLTAGDDDAGGIRTRYVRKR